MKVLVKLIKLLEFGKLTEYVPLFNIRLKLDRIVFDFSKTKILLSRLLVNDIDEL